MQHNSPKGPRVRMPKGLLDAYLQAATRGPWPATTELLGHTPALRRLDIRTDLAGLPGLPGFGDLVLVLAVPGGGAIHAILTGPLARGLVGMLVGSSTDSAPAPQPAPLAPAEAGLLTGLANLALQDLKGEEFGIQDAAVVRDDDNPSPGLPADSALVCELELTCGAAHGRVVLLLDAAAAQELERSVRQWRPSTSEPGGDLPLVAELVLARTELSASLLADAQLGDAIVFPTPAPPDDHWPIHLAVAGLLYPAILRRTEIGREVEIRGDAIEAMDPDDLPDPLPTNLPVPVTAVLGRVEITVGHASELAPGAVISLDHPVGETVQLRAGRILGAGELLEVDGSVGVRLTELTR
jgi:type III secretion system YscQ/HrcQ family protein